MLFRPLVATSKSSYILIIIAFFLNLWLHTPAKADYTNTIVFQNQSRWYEVHLPTGYDSRVPSSVVLVLHGGSCNPDEVKYDSGMNALADKNNFIAVYPAGTNDPGNPDGGLFWNDGRTYLSGASNDHDDVGFIAAVLADLAERYSINKSQVFAAGISNGAAMCYRLVKQLPNQFAAIATIAKQVGADQFFAAPSGPVAIMAFQGKLDPINPYDGGYGSVYGVVTYAYPVTQTMTSWAVHNGYLGAPTEAAICNNAVKTIYSPLDNGKEVVLWTLEDGGHTWPGGLLSTSSVGPISMDISASSEMWEFFKSVAPVATATTATPSAISSTLKKRLIQRVLRTR
jgi:polyhydroxybutyrate depolymerase